MLSDFCRSFWSGRYGCGRLPGRTQFDCTDVVHQICARDGKVAGYQHLLPLTVGSTPDIVSSLRHKPLLRGDAISVLTHYGVASVFAGQGPSSVESELMAGFVEWGLLCGVRKIVIACDLVWLLRASYLEFSIQLLGFETMLENQQLAVALLKFNRHTLQAIRNYRQCCVPVMSLLGETEEKSALMIM